MRRGEREERRVGVKKETNLGKVEERSLKICVASFSFPSYRKENGQKKKTNDEREKERERKREREREKS
jgi:hypothetical protein